MIHVVLFRPEIPPNTGNIARQCVGMNACLHIVGPIDFDISEGAVKRAGLDHWNNLNLQVHEDADTFVKWLGERQPWIVSKHGGHRYDKPAFVDDDVLIFGSETTGLPARWLARWADRSVYVPILGKVRSYNLANTVSIVLTQASLKAGIFNKN